MKTLSIIFIGILLLTGCTYDPEFIQPTTHMSVTLSVDEAPNFEASFNSNFTPPIKHNLSDTLVEHYEIH
jgi:PBP1b-binding outer membrane lipoprotein LpoB